MFGLAGAGHWAAVETFKEWRIQQLMAARMADRTANSPASHAHMAADTGAGEIATDGRSETTAGTAASAATAASSSPPETTAAPLSQSPPAAAAGTQAGALQGKEQGVGERGEQAGVKAAGQWEWPEWLPVRRLGEEEVKQRQEEFRRRVAVAQRLEMAGSGREGGMGGAEGREKGGRGGGEAAAGGVQTESGGGAKAGNGWIREGGRYGRCRGEGERRVRVGTGKEQGVGARGEQAGQWEWPEWLPVRRLGEEEVKQRQEEFRRRVAAAQRLEMAGSGREGGMGGAEGREKGGRGGGEAAAGGVQTESGGGAKAGNGWIREGGRYGRCRGEGERRVRVGTGKEQGVGARGEQAGQWEWPEWLPVRRLGEEEVKQRQEEFRRRVAAAQRLEMAGSGREGGMGGAEGREKGG
ncbi:unnamed protein product [Closterium sp. Yama58-4]|nr:unnamed protein product [Closterium sp. Yama58-4]